MMRRVDVVDMMRSRVAISAVCGCSVLAAAVLFTELRDIRSQPVDGQADRILVTKSDHKMTLLRQGKQLKTYHVALGRGGSGNKVKAGDNKVPEGLYVISGRNPHSVFHRALRISYPTPEQVQRAKKDALDPGGDIMVHGIRNGLGWLGAIHAYVDWTKGCIAVTDEEIEQIWQAVPDGTVIEIRP